MFRLFFLTTLTALVAAKPGVIHGVSAPVTITAHAVGPSGVSHQSRYDIVNPGTVAVSSVQTVPVISVATPNIGSSNAVSSRYDVQTHLGAVGGLGGGYGTYGSYGGQVGSNGGFGGSYGGGYGAGAGFVNGGYGYGNGHEY